MRTFVPVPAGSGDSGVVFPVQNQTVAWRPRHPQRRGANLNIMVCHYCGTQNQQEEHRCTRCGRRAHEAFFSAGSEALAPAPVRAEAPFFDTKPAEPRQTAFAFSGRARTGSSGRVVSINEFRPQAPAAKAAPSQPAPKTPEVNARAEARQRQVKLDFDSTPNPARRVSGQRTGTRTRCEAAAPFRRMVAGLADAGVVAFMLVPVAIAIYSVFGHAWLGDKVKHFYVAAGLLLFGLYKLAWATVDEDSLGIQWCGLQLVNYDNKLPSKRERFLRMAWAVLSLLPGGIGLVWSLVEQDRLTWHDVSTRTYLSTVR